MQFKDLQIGDTFDFIDPENPMRATFHKPCMKVSARKYRSISGAINHYRVGSVHVKVYHVNKFNE